MTSITLTITGAEAVATVKGTLTAGMAGIPVTIKYDNSWNGLIKNLVCKSEPESCSIVNTTRTITNVETTATIAHEVMKANRILYLGVEGYSSDGELIMPTTWAKCGEIHSGTNALADPSANPTLPIWAQLQTELKEIKERTLTEAQISALNNMFRVCAFSRADVSEEYTAFKQAFGITDSGEDSSGGSGEHSGSGNSGETEVTLTSISATYSGGDVAVGTAVTDLTGVVVIAQYSDGGQQTVTGYTLSGTIAEGENTVTVTYEGKSATFTVTGVAESADTWEEQLTVVRAMSTAPTASNDFAISTTTNTGYVNAAIAEASEHTGGVLYVDMEQGSFTFAMAIVLEQDDGTRCGMKWANLSTDFNVSEKDKVINAVVDSDVTFILNTTTGYPFSVPIPDGYHVLAFFRNISDTTKLIAGDGITFTLKGA